MTLFVYHHPAALAHDPGQGHPEAPIRLHYILKGLDAATDVDLSRHEPGRATLDHLLRAHSAAHINNVLDQVPARGSVPLDMDTWLNPHTGEAALRAAGAAVDAVDAVLGGRTRRAFLAMRPPGHHAEPDVAMGFCFFNNVAIGALHALDAHGLSRVAVTDFDVHHGNGTQAIFESDPRLFYASIHEAPLYPGTGRESEAGVGNVFNTCVQAGTDGARWRAALEARILPALDAFQPELVMISAGFDAHLADPLANLRLTEDDFAWITERLVEIAERHAEGRVISVLEGGYDPPALTRSVLAHLRAMEDRA